MKLWTPLVIALVLLQSCKGAPTKTDEINYGFNPPPLWNESMQNLKQLMISLQPYIFNSSKFKDVKNEEFLKKNIHELAIEASNVKHSPLNKTLDPTIRFVASQFSAELQQADENFKNGWADYSRSQLLKVNSYCLECHTRMKQGPAFKTENDNKTFIQSLPISNQVEFMIAFREFDSAFDLIINELKKSQTQIKVDLKSENLAKLGLQIAVQFMNDPSKAHKLTKTIDENPSLPEYVKKSNTFWKKSIAVWETDAPARTLADVRSIVKKRISEVEDMRAISVLLNVLTENLNDDELGEALLLTGQSYDELNKFSVVPLQENYYESCIYKAPQTKWAQICLSKYSDSIIMSYTGSSGTHMPVNAKQKLEQLRKIIKDAQNPKK